jgi:hypothetical protein
MMRALVLALVFSVALACPAWAEGLTDQERERVTFAYLEGNLEALAPLEANASGPDELLPFAIRSLWWRPDPRASAAYDAAAAASEGLTRARYDWLMAPAPRGAFPMPDVGESDPWPMISAIVADRIERERRGLDALLEPGAIERLASILGALPDDQLDDASREALWYLDQALNQQSDVAYGVEPTEQDLADEQGAASIRRRNAILAVVSLVLLVAGALALGFFGGGHLGGGVTEPER